MAPEPLVRERASVIARQSVSEVSDSSTNGGTEQELGGAGGRKRKITISLSEKSIAALEELRRATDADTDSEVFRNALRLHLTLVRAHAAGVRLFMKRKDSEESLPVTLFADDTSA
jgi:hypothetical protein